MNHFGSSIALFNDWLAVGACYDDIYGNVGKGAVYMFKRTDSNWSYHGIIKPTSSYSYFGGCDMSNDFHDAIDMDENRMIVGSYLQDSGKAFVYKRVSDSWNLEKEILPLKNNGQDFFGYSVAIHDDIIAIGAPKDDSNLSGPYNFDENSKLFQSRFK